MTAWLAFLLGGMGTYLMRLSFIGLMGGRTMPASVERALSYVGPSVFAAIVMPAVLGDDGVNRLWSPDPQLIAALIAGYVTWRTRNIPLMLVVGMATLWLLQWSGWFG